MQYDPDLKPVTRDLTVVRDIWIGGRLREKSKRKSNNRQIPPCSNNSIAIVMEFAGFNL